GDLGGGDAPSLHGDDVAQDIDAGHQALTAVGAVSVVGRCVIAISFSRVARARPDAMASAANATPALSVSALPATTSAAAALSSTILRYGPGLPASMSRMACAFVAGSEPLSASGAARGRPASSGVTSKVATLPSFNS